MRECDLISMDSESVNVRHEKQASIPPITRTRVNPSHPQTCSMGILAASSPPDEFPLKP